MQLYLDSFGAYLFIRNGMFAVKLKSGAEHTFAVRNVGAILQTAGTAMSADALLLAAQSDIPVILIDAQTHEPLAHLSSGRAVSVAAIRRNQAVFSRSPEGYAWAAKCLSEKITGQLELLENTRTNQSLPTDETFKKARETMRRQAQALAGWTPQEPFVPFLAAERFRGQEGTASRLYFQELGRLLDPALGFRGRTGRPAFDPFNALLNYLYGMLYTSVHLALLKTGLDPYMAVLHADQYGGKPTMAYDFIEPYRPWADQVALELAFSGVAASPAFFRADPDDRGLWLDSKGKSAVIDAMLAFMKTSVLHGGRQVRRGVLIDLAAQKLAVSLKTT